MRPHLATGVAVALSLFVSSAALACEGSSVLYEDDFSSADPAWGNYSDLKIDNGVLTLLVNPDSGYPLENQSGFFEGNYDICVDVVQKNTDPSTSWASLLFWGTDYDNYYLFQAATNGYVNVARKQKGRWLNPVNWIQTNGVVKPGTESNNLRVVIVGNQVTGYVNGQQVLQFKGQPPEGGGLIGVYGNSPKDAAASYDFDNYKVTSVDE
ncbi:MAG: hypothetical protein KF723_11890 [Rhizobiaceae bacterium]|nr:hypothetical protein [Rhizobiaceae bacterium]